MDFPTAQAFNPKLDVFPRCREIPTPLEATAQTKPNRTKLLIPTPVVYSDVPERTVANAAASWQPHSIREAIRPTAGLSDEAA